MDGPVGGEGEGGADAAGEEKNTVVSAGEEGGQRFPNGTVGALYIEGHGGVGGGGGESGEVVRQGAGSPASDESDGVAGCVDGGDGEGVAGQLKDVVGARRQASRGSAGGGDLHKDVRARTGLEAGDLGG